MGGILGGKSKQTQTQSSNSGAFLEQLLGVGGDPAAGFQNYLKNAGFSSAVGQGLDDIDAGAAASGMLRSGATGKAYGAYTNDMRNQYFQNYLGNLLGTAQVQNTTTGSKKEKPGLGKFIGAGASLAAASDRRLKKNIFKVGELPNGLGVYQYRYLDDTGPFMGVMADEVEKVAPEALGPELEGGYKTVNYSKIEVN